MQLEDIPRVAPPVLAVFGQESENEALTDELALDGYEVRLVSDLARLGEVDVLVFGRATRRGAGLGALRALRRDGLAASGALVLWMSTTSNPIDTLRAFEAGADDVIRAPFVYAELLARVRALLRRPTGETPSVLRYEALTIHTATRTVIYRSTPVELRRREYALLLYLGARDPTRVFTKAELLRHVWGYPSGDKSRTLDSHACRLRSRLAEAGAAGWVASTWASATASSPQTSRLNSSRLIPAVRRMFPSVPLLIGWLPWTGTGIASGTVGWRRMWWLPRTRLTYQPWPSRILTSCLPETAGV